MIEDDWKSRFSFKFLNILWYEVMSHGWMSQRRDYRSIYRRGVGLRIVSFCYLTIIVFNDRASNKKSYTFYCSCLAIPALDLCLTLAIILQGTVCLFLKLLPNLRTYHALWP